MKRGHSSWTGRWAHNMPCHDHRRKKKAKQCRKENGALELLWQHVPNGRQWRETGWETQPQCTKRGINIYGYWLCNGQLAEFCSTHQGQMVGRECGTNSVWCQPSRWTKCRSLGSVDTGLFEHVWTNKEHVGYKSMPLSSNFDLHSLVSHDATGWKHEEWAKHSMPPSVQLHTRKC